MTRIHKNFGEYIQDGLTTLGYGIHQTVIDARDHELEQFKTGFVNDEYKLKVLKRDLYQAARARANPEYIQGLRSAIATLTTQVENERNYRNTFSYHIYGILNSAILLAILTASLSFPIAWGCSVVKSQSQACQLSRIIPVTTLKFFSEPK